MHPLIIFAKHFFKDGGLGNGELPADIKEKMDAVPYVKPAPGSRESKGDWREVEPSYTGDFGSDFGREHRDHV